MTISKAEPPGMAKKLQDEKVRSGVWGGPGPRICEAVKKTKYRKTSKICFVVIPIFRGWSLRTLAWPPGTLDEVGDGVWVFGRQTVKIKWLNGRKMHIELTARWFLLMTIPLSLLVTLVDTIWYLSSRLRLQGGPTVFSLAWVEAFVLSTFSTLLQTSLELLDDIPHISEGQWRQG